MRFSSAVDSLSKENQFLRLVTKILILAVLSLSLAVLFLHDKKPVVVERSSRGLEIVRMTTLTRTEADVEQATRLMLRARFDSGAVAPEALLSKRQIELRETEQREMKSRSLSQNVVFRKAVMANGEALVEFDRVLSLGEVRSALKTSVKIAFEEIEPNELNPYGLRLADARLVDKPPKKE